MITFPQFESMSVSLLHAVPYLVQSGARPDVKLLHTIDKDKERLASAKLGCLVLNSHRSSKLTTDFHVSSDGNTHALWKASVHSQGVNV